MLSYKLLESSDNYLQGNTRKQEGSSFLTVGGENGYKLIRFYLFS
jgi:hypothetical protein